MPRTAAGSLITLYIATSLDGYIARENGEVDWLFHDQDYGFGDFYGTVGSIVMGGATYRQMLTFGDFPFSDKDCFVFTRSDTGAGDKNAVFISGDIREALARIGPGEGKNIWLLGGADLAGQFLQHDLIDEYVLSVHPILLGAGIPLFPGDFDERRLKLVSVKSFETGLVQITCSRP